MTVVIIRFTAHIHLEPFAEAIIPIAADYIMCLYLLKEKDRYFYVYKHYWISPSNEFYYDVLNQ